MYEDYYEISDENFDFNTTVNKLLEMEIENRISGIKNERDRLISQNKAYQEKNYDLETRLNAQIKENGVAAAKDEFVKDILLNLNKDTVEDFISLIYKPDFNERAQHNDAPTWFKLIINYYSIKDKIIALLKSCNIDVPDKAYSFRLPFDWTEEELDIFFETMGNHYVCNGCIYSENIGFWYRERLWDKPIENCRHNYSEIPWQFILRNPLLNSDKYIKKIVETINKDKSGHGKYLAKIMDYQTLSDENIKYFVNNIKYPQNYNEEIFKTLSNNIQFIEGEKNTKAIYSLLKNSWNPISKIELLPKKYLLQYLNQLETDKLPGAIKKCNSLSQDEKLNLLKKCV